MVGMDGERLADNPRDGFRELSLVFDGVAVIDVVVGGIYAGRCQTGSANRA